MFILADVAVAGIALATIVFLPVSLICTVLFAALLRAAASSQWRLLYLLFLLPVGLFSGTALVVTSSWALAFALPGGQNHPLFVWLYLTILAALAILHYVVLRIFERKPDA